MSTPSTPSNPSRPRRRVTGIRRPRVAGRVAGSAEPTTPEPTPAGGIDLLDGGVVDLVKRPEAARGTEADTGPDADELGPDGPAPVDIVSDGVVSEDVVSDEPEPVEPEPVEPGEVEPGEVESAEEAEPRPSGKRLQRRRAPRPADEAGRSAGAGRFGPVAARLSRIRLKVPTAALAAVAVLLAALAGFFAVENAQVRGTAAAQNTALVDVGATAQVTQQVSDALAKVYSFDYTRLDQNEAAARSVITPAFESSFQGLFKQVRELAPQQKAVVSATVNMTAVRSITDDTAVLLVFLDQQATRAADNGQAQQLAAAGRLTVTAQKVDGVWKIANVVPQ